MAAEWEAVDHHHHHATTNTGSTMPPAPSMSHYFYGSGGGGASSSSFNLSFAADDFSIPAVPVKSEEAAELEWLSNFVDDSYSYYPSSCCYPPEAMAAAQQLQQPSNKQNGPGGGGGGDDYYTNTTTGVRRCTHCASEKTPQWRTGPLGPKTLCNACGVRYKSGRLVPEYRPAASPTFVLTQHSNSHRKVMELRRQKELIHLRGSASSSSSSSPLFRDYYGL